MVLTPSIPGVEIESKLGEGAQSIVYRAHDGTHEYAVKVQRDVEPQQARDVRTRFIREAAALARLDHPSLPNVWKSGTHEGRRYLVMDFVAGQSLDAYLGDWDAVAAEAAAMGVDIGGALAELHAAGLVHRDIKPSNILWDGQRASLVDFGLVGKAVGRAEDASESDRDVVGTFLYASPEQLRVLKRPVGRASDLYSLGAVLYHLLSGRPPLAADDIESLIQAHATRRVRPLADVTPGVPSEFAAVVDALLTKEPGDRPASAGSVAEAFARVGGAGRDLEQTVAVPRTSGDSDFELATAGRRRAVEELRESWGRFQDSEGGRVSLLRGGWGLGKTELLEAFVEGIRDPATLVLRVVGAEGPHQPLEGIAEILGAFVRETGRRDGSERPMQALREAADRSRVSMPVRDVFLRLVGETAGELPDTSTATTDQFIGESARLIGSLCDGQGPTLLVVEGAEHFDHGSRLVLRRLCLLLEQFDVYVLLSVEDATEAAADLVGGLQTDLGLEPPEPGQGVRAVESERALDIRLGPLDKSGVTQVVWAYLGARLTDARLVEQLHAISGGRPLAVRKTLDVLVEQEVIRPEWGEWHVEHHQLDAVGIPSDARSILTGRIEGLDAELFAFCRAAAVWGRSFEFQVLVEAFDWTAAQVSDFVEQCIDREIVVRTDGESDGERYRFVHRALRAAICEMAADGDLQAAHLRYARWLDATGGDAFRMASHYARSGGADPRRVWESCLEAGRRASREFAPERTREFLTAALEVADAVDAQVPADVWYLLGWAHVHLEDVEAAERFLKRAVAEAESDFDQAKCELARADIEAARMQFDRVKQAAQRALELLGRPVPHSGLGRIVHGVTAFGRARWHNWVGEAMPIAASTDRCNLEQRNRAYELLGYAGVFQEDFILTAFAEVNSMATGAELGASVELVRAHSSSGVLAALRGRFDRAEASLQRARRLADRLGDPRAEAHAEIVGSWIVHLSGRPLEAIRIAEPILRDRPDQLEFLTRSQAFEEIAVNVALRGHSREVRRWFRRWRSMHDDSGDRHPPSTMYSTVLPHLRRCGDDAMADEIRQISRTSLEDVDAVFLRKSHWSAVMMDEVVQGGASERVESFLERRLQMGVDPGDEAFWGKVFLVNLLYARRYLLERSPASESTARLEDFAAAVEWLEESAPSHPSYQGHALVGRAELEMRRGATAAAHAALGRAEQQALAVSNHWVAWEVARLRARWAAEADQPQVARSYAQAGASHARRAGWRPAAAGILERYDVEEPSEAPLDSDTDSDRSARQIQMERKLDALLEVSLATTSVLDPEEVSRAIVETCIRVFGAQRGFLFLSDSEGPTLWETRPSVGLRADGERLDEPGDYSRTVVESVVRDGEAMVVSGTREGPKLGAESIVRQELRSIIAAPIFLDDRLMGVIYLDNRLVESVFDEHDVEILRAISHHIPVALETARTAQLEVEIAAERQRRNDAERLRSFAETVNTLLDTTAILERLVEQGAEVLEADAARGYVLDDRGLQWRCRLSDDRRAQPISEPGAAEPDARPGSFVRDVVDSGGMHAIPEVGPEERGEEPMIAEEAASWLAVALCSGDSTVGVGIFEARRPDAFAAGAAEQVLALAGQAGIAIEKTRLATIDPLTGLYNRRKFFDLADREMARQTRYGGELSVLLVDIDDFKAVNDTHGHAAGDRLLETLADTCLNSLRRSDVLGRYGGDEFAAVLPHTGLAEAQAEVAERLRAEIAATTFDVDGRAIEVTVSVGVAGADGERDVRELLERADRAMYRAKESGKDRVTGAAGVKA